MTLTGKQQSVAADQRPASSAGGYWAGRGKQPERGEVLSKELLKKIDAYWRAANYVAIQPEWAWDGLQSGGG